MYSFTGFMLAPLSSYVTAVRGSWSVARALTTTNALFALGSIIGPLLGGTLGEKLGLRNIYGIASGLFLISAWPSETKIPPPKLRTSLAVKVEEMT